MPMTFEASVKVKAALFLAIRNDESRLYMLSPDDRAETDRQSLKTAIATYNEAIEALDSEGLKESFNGSEMLRDAMRKSEFLTAYVEALFFTEVTPDSEEDMQGKDVDDISYQLARQLIHDCAIFEAAHERNIDSAYSSAGHDFWLTRNGHGAGFWDGDWPKEEGERMNATSKAFGSCEIYAGDDGLLYAI